MREHWGAIENGHHHRRDRAYREDQSPVCDPSATPCYAALRAVAIFLCGQHKRAERRLRDFHLPDFFRWVGFRRQRKPLFRAAGRPLDTGWTSQSEGSSGTGHGLTARGGISVSRLPTAPSPWFQRNTGIARADRGFSHGTVTPLPGKSCFNRHSPGRTKGLCSSAFFPFHFFHLNHNHVLIN